MPPPSSLFSGMPLSPLAPLPRVRRKTSVSRLSSALWAVARASISSFSMILRKNSYLTSLAVSSTPFLRSLASAGTSASSTKHSTPSSLAFSTQKSLSRKASSPRIEWLTWAANSFTAFDLHHDASRCRRKEESAPPEYASSRDFGILPRILSGDLKPAVFNSSVWRIFALRKIAELGELADPAHLYVLG